MLVLLLDCDILANFVPAFSYETLSIQMKHGNKLNTV